MTPRRSSPALPLPLAKAICLLSGGGDRGLCSPPTSPPGRGDAMRGNAATLSATHSPSPLCPAVSSLAKLMEYLSLLFFPLIPLFLVLKKKKSL